MFKIKKPFILSFIFAIVLGIGAFLAPNTNTLNAFAASPISETSIFTFTVTSEQECNVRLLDKTVTRAIIPTTAVINEVEYNVTSVAANGFANSSNLEKVWLPKTIKTINASSFMGCRKLKSIALSAVETIGANAFAMTSLEYLILPKTVTSVAATILRSCSTPVYVMATQEQVTNSNWNTNWNGSNTESIVEYNSSFVPPIQYRYIENTPQPSTFGVSTFAEVDGTWIVDDYQPFVTESGADIYIPAEHEGKPVVAIADYAFTYNNLNSITIGYSSTSIRIGSYAFYYFEGSAITINREVAFEDDFGMPSEFVFSSTMASKIILPNTISEFGNSAFQDSVNLTDINFIEPELLTQIEEEELAGNLISTQIASLPATITTLGSDVFSGVSNILELNIPSSVVNVGANAFVGWINPQIINIDYASEDVLGTGWHEFWNSSCDLSIINYSVPQIFNITYNLNGGNHSDNPATYTPKDAITFNEPIRTGYTFNGWYNESNVRVYGISLGSVGHVTLEARWTANTYKIKYESNKPSNSSGSIVGATGESNHTYDLSGALTPNGYSIAGWAFIGWKDLNNTSYTDASSVLNWTSANNETITLYAQWVAQTYTVSYHDNRPGTASDAVIGFMENTSHTYDSASLLRINTFTLTGWTFAGWKDASGTTYVDGQYVSTLSQGGTIALMAQWVQNDYTIVYDSNKPGNSTNSVIGSMSNTTHKYDASSVLRSNEFSLNGWVFAGWNTSANGSGVSYLDNQNVSNMTTAANSVVVLYAQWTSYTYTIVYNGNGDYGSTASSLHTYDVSKVLSINTFYKKGYHVKEWTTEANGTGISYLPTQSVINLTNINGGTITLYAQWTPNTYIIYYDGNGATGGSMQYTEQVYDAPLNLRDNGFVKTGYGFTGWKLADGTWPTWVRPWPDPGPIIHNFVESGSITIYASWDIFSYSVEMVGWCPQDQRSPWNIRSANLKFDQEYSYTPREHCEVGSGSIVCGYVFSHWELTSGEGVDLNWTSTNRTITVKNVTNVMGTTIRYTAVYVAPNNCVAEGTLITLADGSQKAVETLDGTEMLLVWNLKTGTFDVAPITFIDSDPLKIYNIIHLYFSDGSEVKVIGEHAFWDINLNRYVFLREDAAQYIGHSFNKQITNANGLSWTGVELVNVEIYAEETTSWSPVTFEHLAYYVNGMLSMPGATEGLINIFEVDSDTMKYDQVAFDADIAEYGLFTYEDFADLMPETIFDAFDIQYLKVSIGKGLIDWNQIEQLIESYSKFF